MSLYILLLVIAMGLGAQIFAGVLVQIDRQEPAQHVCLGQGPRMIWGVTADPGKREPLSAKAPGLSKGPGGSSLLKPVKS